MCFFKISKLFKNHFVRYIRIHKITETFLKVLRLKPDLINSFIHYLQKINKFTNRKTAICYNRHQIMHFSGCIAIKFLFPIVLAQPAPLPQVGTTAFHLNRAGLRDLIPRPGSGSRYLYNAALFLLRQLKVA